MSRRDVYVVYGCVAALGLATIAGCGTVRDRNPVPEELSESEALQLIIRLFDMAGHLSEQIESAIGLENQTGYEALQNLEKRVMSAVVTISQNYENGNSLYGGTPRNHPRF